MENNSELNLNNVINMLRGQVKKNEKLFEEIHEEYKDLKNSRREENNSDDEEGLLLSGKSKPKFKSISRTELAKTLASISSTNISGTKMLFDAVKEKELIEIKRDELELRRNIADNENKSKIESTEILREALSKSHNKAKLVADELIDKYHDKGSNLKDITKKLADLNLDTDEELEFSESEKNAINISNAKKSKINLNNVKNKNEDKENEDDDDWKKYLDKEAFRPQVTDKKKAKDSFIEKEKEEGINFSDFLEDK